MAGEKTEKATPKRKQDERKKGNVFLSQEAITTASLLVSFSSLKLLGPWIFTNLQDMTQKYLSMGAAKTTLTEGDMKVFFVEACIVFAKTALPLLLICGFTAIMLTMAQTRLLVTFKSIGFKANRLSPLNGFKKMFSMRSAVDLLKSLVKIIVLGIVIYQVLQQEILLLPRLMDMAPQEAIFKTANAIWDIALQASIAFVVLAAADYFYQWWEYEKNLRMSKQDIKEEYKQTEGDPQIKGRQRSAQQQRARQRMMQSVSGADVVIRNPTHFAVAIRYNPDENIAPVVVAKGMDSLALRIVAVAEEHGVYVTENRPLARALYDAVDVDEEIPEKFYQAIAQVLAFVYSLKKKDLK